MIQDFKDCLPSTDGSSEQPPTLVEDEATVSVFSIFKKVTIRATWETFV